MEMTPEEVELALELLAKSHQLEPDSPAFLALEQASAHLRKAAKKKRRLRRKQQARDRDQALRDGLRSGGERLHRQRACYVCKRPYRELHPVYASLCVPCGEASLERRALPVSLEGRRALVTGGRVKIGYQVALGLLRAGASVTVTTRFPADAARRYRSEPDADAWIDRLSLHGLDFRHLPAVFAAIEAFAREPLDILVNNAAQTVWQPPEAMAALVAAEQESPFPVVRWQEAALDTIDVERTHSWVAELHEVPAVEMIECQVVNNIVPFLLCSRLQATMERSPHPDRYIVNVAALEGQFAREGKLSRHPHTNMAKAALNMLTRTSAPALAERGIHLVSVDPGWVSHEGPPDAVERAFASGFTLPLEMQDAAARILHPIAAGVMGDPIHGVLLKDYRIVPW